MPVDPKPVLYWAVPGGVARIVMPEGKVLSCALQGATKDSTGLGYTPHWATCAARQSFKKARKKQVGATQESLF